MTRTAGSLGLVHGQVRLAEPDAAWPRCFAEEKAALSAALKAFEPAIEHCGSTSVAGLPAKPIIDILVGLSPPLDLDALKAALGPLGYEHATWAGVPGNEVFAKGAPRTHLLHAVPRDGRAWSRMLQFRDALRADPALAADYAVLKRKLAQHFASDRAGYTAAKSDFVLGVLAADGARTR